MTEFLVSLALIVLVWAASWSAWLWTEKGVEFLPTLGRMLLGTTLAILYLIVGKAHAVSTLSPDSAFDFSWFI